MGLSFDRIDVEPISGSSGRFESARGSWASRRALVVRLRTGDGDWFEGEAAPLPGWSKESLAEVQAQAKRLDPCRIDVRGSWRRWRFGPVAPSLRFALETAAVSARARAEGRPRVAIQGGDPRRRVPINGVVDALGAGGVVQAVAWIRAGVRTLKIKVGRPGRSAEERSLLERLAAETAAVLRLDANGRLAAELRTWALEFSASGRLEYVEDAGGVAALPRALDAELLQRPERVREPGVVAVVFKPTLWGGLGPIARWAAAARTAGRSVVVTHALEVGPGFEAVVDLARALGTPGVAQGVAPHPFVPSKWASQTCLQGWVTPRA